MPTAQLSERSPRRLLSAVGLALVAGVTVFLGVLFLSGQFGMVLKGIRLTDPVDGAIPTTLLQLAVAAGATAGALFAPTEWESPAARPAARAGLVGLAVLLIVNAPQGSELVMLALPAAVALVALVANELRLRVQEPLRRESANDYLWTSLLFASVYGLLAAVLT